jgi:transcriptional regulator with XRE-family HTH domain
MLVAHELRELQEKLGYTQVQLADALDTSQSNISYMLKERAKNPRPSAKIASAITGLKAKHPDVFGQVKQA